MKAVILLATLKKDGLSNTQTLCEFLQKHLEAQKIESTIIKLVDHHILPGTCSNMGKGDEWPKILEQILAAEIVIFATPIWWNNQSSEMQRVIERLDELHDEILAGNQSRLEGKVAGIVITGDSDGAQTIIANLGNYCNAIGLLLPPYATLSVLWEGQAKDHDSTRQELMKKYEKDYAATAKTMASQLAKFSRKTPA